MRQKFLLFVLALATLGFVSFTSQNSFAYYDVLDSGEVMEKGHYKLTPNMQILTESGGLNIGTIFDAGFNEEVGARVLAGFGRTDGYIGAMAKWMPIPDVEGQPAVGGNFGIVYAKDGDIKDFTIRFEPLVSKRVRLDSTLLTPYASIPLGIRFRNEEYSTRNGTATNNFVRLASQVVVGSQIQIEKWQTLQFLAELGLDVDNAYSYVTLSGIFYFDTEKGFRIE